MSGVSGVPFKLEGQKATGAKLAIEYYKHTDGRTEYKLVHSSCLGFDCGSLGDDLDGLPSGTDFQCEKGKIIHWSVTYSLQGRMFKSFQGARG